MTAWAALLMHVAWAGELGPGAEPDLSEVVLVGRLMPTVGTYGASPGVGVTATWAPSKRVALGSSIDWFAPGAIVGRGGARWLVLSHRDEGGSVGLAVVARGAVVTRFTGRLDTVSGGVGPALEMRWRRLGVAVAAPIGGTWSDFASGWHVGADLLDASLSVTVGRERRGTLALGSSTSLPVTLLTYARRTRWGRWRIGLGLTSALVMGLPVEVGVHR